MRALEPLTLHLERGEVLALLGPNGAGKSTTIKLVLGLLFPSRGRVLVFGGSPRRAEQRRRLGYLPEETRLPKFLTPRETIHLFGRLHGLSRAERRRRSGELLEMVGLQGSEDRPVGEFSKGMARRIGLAVALTGDPDLLILDEPTSGLDPLGVREIKTLLLDLRARGRSVLLSSHLLDDVEDVADRIAILYGGKLRRLGSTDELLARSERVRIELERPQELSQDEISSRVQASLGTEVEVSVPRDRLEALFQRVVEEAQEEQWATAGAKLGGKLAGFLSGGARAPKAPAPAPSKVEPEAEAPPPAPQIRVEPLRAAEAPLVEACAEAAPVAAEEAPTEEAPTEEAPTEEAPTEPASTPARDDATPENLATTSAAPEGASSEGGEPPHVDLSACAPQARALFSRLLGQDKAHEPEVQAQPEPTALAAPLRPDALAHLLSKPAAPLTPPPEAEPEGTPQAEAPALPAKPLSAQGQAVLGRLLRRDPPQP